MPKKIFFFVTFLRAIAALIITNAHYVGVYPTDLIANGGVLGDVLFFSISGFCLANPKLKFGKWLLHRYVRIYIVVWVITIAYLLIGAYTIDSFVDVIKWFIHPTKYHFVASITLLYIPIYFIAKYYNLKTKSYVLMMLALFAIQMGIYLTIYDTSYYHIDTVREPLILFLWIQTMILGLHFRWRSDNNTAIQISRPIKIGAASILTVLYFASKMSFVKIDSIAPYQILNQVVLFLLLFLIFDIAQSYEKFFENLSNKKIWTVIQWLSDHTLEIYCVQYVIIRSMRTWNLGPFPLNWIAITFTIIVAAYLLRKVSQTIIKRINV